MEKLYLWEQGQTPLFNPDIQGQDEPSLSAYPVPWAAEEARPAVVVLPGGAYVEKVAHEKLPIARTMHEMGFHAFILDYRVAPYRWPSPLLDCQRAIRYLRCHAAELHVRPDKIAVIGFSAGGHLCGMSGTVWDEGDPNAQDPVERYSCRPDACVPCYAVLDLPGALGHAGSKENMLSGVDAGKFPYSLCAWENVGPDTPPCFLFHTAKDNLVPVENSLRMAEAMAKAGATVELTVFPHGGHGVSMGLTTPLANAFPSLLQAFLKDQGF